MHAVERAALEALRGPCGVTAGQKLLLAVSGGPDSVALLHALLALRPRLPLRLEVVHFDHGLRPASLREAEWVRGLAHGAGLPFHLRRSGSLAALGSGVQAAARDWRRAELLRLRAATGAHAIATGHQQGDQMETLLLKLLRGAHLSRLRGMDWRSGAFIRPLLAVPRADLQAYLRARGLPWLEDPSNRSGKYRRNRVRHELVPLLDDLAGGAIAARLGALEMQSRELEAWLERLPAPRMSRPGSAAPWLEVAGLRRLPPLARAHRLVAFIERDAPGDLSSDDVAQALRLLEAPRGPKWAQWALHLPGGRTLKRQGARLLLERRGAAPADVVHAVADVQVHAPAGWVAAAQRGAAARGGLRLANIPPGAVLHVRARRPGDRFHPPWRGRDLKVKDFLRDQGVPLWQRDRLPVVELEGRIVAIGPRYVARGHAVPPGAAQPNARGILTLQLKAARS